MDIEQSPEAVPQETFQPVKVGAGGPTYVTFDLETTDLSKILQNIFEMHCIYYIDQIE